MQKRGIILCLLSSETFAIKIIDDPKTPVLAVSLTHISSPRLGSFDGRISDEPFAWDAFNFSRKRFLSQRVYVEQFGKTPDQTRTHPSFGPLPLIYARVNLADQDKQDLGIILVSEGWAKVHEKAVSDDDYVPTLLAAQHNAKEAHLGIWGQNGLVRSLPVEINPMALRQKEYVGIIDNIMNGSTYSVILLPRFEHITISLAGIKCPSAKRTGTGPDPFGLEAKSFVESRLLQRQVTIFLYDYNNETLVFHARVIHPKGGDIAPLLLSEGLAQIHTPSLVFLESSNELRQAELTGKSHRKNLFRDFDVSSLRSIQINGRVQSIKGSSSLEVDTGDKIRRVFLSGCKIPSFVPDQKYDSRAFECRERLRKLLIGKQVQCHIDYTLENRDYATVFIGHDCVNEILLSEGLATIVLSKAGQSDNIDQFMKCEKAAKDKKLGLHSTVPAKINQLNDLANNHSRQRSYPFLHFLQGKRQKGIIEYFASCSRMSVLIPSQNCIIRLNLNGVIPSDPNSRLGGEALKFVNDEFLQHDAEFDIIDVDKTGCFIGSCFVDSRSLNLKQCSLAALVVERGFVELNGPAARKSRERAVLEDAEERAKSAGIGVWSDGAKHRFRMEYDHPYSVALMDVWDPVTVVLQLKGKALNTINQFLPMAKVQAPPPMKGDFLAAIYDGKLYRVIIRDIFPETQEAECEYVELCIKEKNSYKNLRILPEQLTGIPPQAFPAKLACCKPFEIDDNFTDEAIAYIFDLIGDGALYAHLIKEGQLPEVLLTDGEEIDSGSVNSMVLQEGWAHFHHLNVAEDYMEIIHDLEDIDATAREEKKGGWTFGMIAGADDDE